VTSTARPTRSRLETAPFRPTSPYAASKAAAELAAGQFARAGSDVVVTRAFQHEGPGRDERFAVGSWAAQIARAEETGRGTVLVGDLSPRRDITDVRDVTRAYEALLDPSRTDGTYNVASGHPVAMREVLDILVSSRGARSRGRGGSNPIPAARSPS
jgi:GDP-4-dehydro-6-deoxy-D-mannose reductase